MQLGKSTLFFIDGEQPVKLSGLTKTKLVKASKIVVKKGKRVDAHRITYILNHYKEKITFIE